MKDKVLYIYTQQGMAGPYKRTDSFPQLQVYHSGSLEIVALLLPLKHTSNSESRAPHWMACKERARQGGERTKLKMNPVRPHHPLAHKSASMKLIWTIFLF